jgi:hypothetical protein
MLGNLIPIHVNFGQSYKLHDFKRRYNVLLTSKLATITVVMLGKYLDFNGSNKSLDNDV